MKILIRNLSQSKEGAGCLVYCSATDRFLIAFRSRLVDSPHTYSVFGGLVEFNETLSRAAIREFREECGYEDEIQDVRLLYKYVSDSSEFVYTTFLAIVDSEFEPHLNWETERTEWVTRKQLGAKQNLHYGLKALLNDYGAKRVLMEARRDPAGIEKVRKAK